MTPYPSLRDFASVAFIGATPTFIIMNSNLLAKDVKESVALARANPDRYNDGNASAGSAPNLAFEMLKLVELLKATIDTAVVTKAVRPNEFERVIVDSSVQGKAIAFPTDSRLLEIARHKVVTAAKSAGIALKQTFAREGKTLRRRTGGYAHAKQYKWLRRALKRQRAALRIVLREAPRKIATATTESGATPHRLQTMMEHAERIRTQRPKDKGKLYAMLAPEVEGICKGNARQPYKFGATASIAVTHRRGLIVGARTFQGNPYDGHILSAQLEQTSTLLDDLDRAPKQIVLDLGCRGVDTDNP